MKKNLLILVLGGFFLIGCAQEQKEAPAPSSDVVTKEEQSAMTPQDVLNDLKAGNERFVNGNLTPQDFLAQAEITAKEGQFPKAAILSCLDSRVPVETVFDQAIGDVFVGRVAGNIEDVDMLGSFEFATAAAGSKLVVVLGHSSCGAVKGSIDRAAVKELGHKNLNVLVDDINPAVENVLKEGEERSSKNKDLVNRAIEENVKLTMQRIREKSETLRTQEENGQIMIVGGVYDLATGKVTWL